MLGAHFEDKGDEPPSKTLARSSWDEEQDMVLTEEPSFYNWLSDVDALQDAFNWLVEGLEFDVENDLWESGWGPKPATLDEQKARVRELVEAAPKLIPVIGHRYLLAEPCVPGNPVLSIYQSDVVVYGEDLRDFLLHELGDWLGLRDWQTADVLQSKGSTGRDESYYETIPFWGGLIG